MILVRGSNLGKARTGIPFQSRLGGDPQEENSHRYGKSFSDFKSAHAGGSQSSRGGNGLGKCVGKRLLRMVYAPCDYAVIKGREPAANHGSHRQPLQGGALALRRRRVRSPGTPEILLGTCRGLKI